MKKALLLGILAALLLVPSVAFADINDTPAGYIITALGTDCSLSYTDVVLTSKPTQFATNILVTVSPEYGFTGLASLGAITTQPGIAKAWNYTVTNEGDNSDNYIMKYIVSYFNCSGAGWKVELINNTGAPTTVSTLAGVAGTNVVATGAVGEDGKYLPQILVTPSTLDAQAPNGSYCVVTLDVSTAATPVGVYLGANGIQYGGTREALDTTVTSIESSLMTLTRIASIDAPTQYITFANAQLGGDHSHDPVPGAVITYSIVYSNLGAITGEQVVIMDKVPGSTEAAHTMAGSGYQPAALTNVTITAPSPDAVGWTGYYSTSATPGLGFNNFTGWVTITAVPSSFATNSGIKYVKFEKQHVIKNEAKRLTWGVMIR